ncbi:CDP-diacylglycerol--serine O-phosphatidyltransferase [Undibacterium sp. RuTC16W]|uniref:CDP-diacylglycerol--serine O-phosphatidyltransferase n=1 Tax=Undibacterium sp. RuTC16W TaxID=3413048 RepID=UPI003BF21C3F
MALFNSRDSLDQLPLIPLRASSVTTLHSAAAYRAELLQQIAGARHRIYLCSLYLQHDEAGAEILAALHAAKALRPALDIRVLVDWHRAQRGLIGEARQANKQAGNAGWYQDQALLQSTDVPIYGVPVQTRELFGVLHLKGFVIDDVVIYSGASLNNVYLHKQDKYRHDRYLLIQNKNLADSMVQFIREHILAAAAVHKLDTPQIPSTRSIRREIHEFREQLKRARYYVPYAPSSTPAIPQLTVTPLVGVGKNNPLNRVICQLLAASREQITICTPYFNFPLAVTREINRALKRGVNIDIIVGDKTANDFYIPPEQRFKVIGALPYLYETNLRRFAKAHQAELGRQLHLHLWKDGDNTYHLKGMWIDQHIMLVTGNNLNPRAFRLDLENALLIRDPEQELAEQRQDELRSIFQHTKAIAHYSEIEKTLDYPPAVRRLLGRLSRTRMDRLAYRVL